MADDGLLLNFSLGEGPVNSKSNVKGGTWRARRRIQKQAQHWNKSNSNGGGNEEPNGRPTKRQRIDNSFHPATFTKPRDTNGGERPRTGQKQVISSLFTYNPTPTTEDEPETRTADAEENVKPSNAPLSVDQLGLVSTGLSPALASHLANKMNIKAPTAIQKAAIRCLVNNDTDAFIQAETGSGKTLAYLLPIIQRIMQMSEGDNMVHRDSGLFAIILAPTRELSKQISVVLQSVLRCAHWIVPGTVIGGENRKSEKARLRKGLNILVATPGRLADHINNTEVLDVSKVRWLVLDEGDRFMELGFEEDIKNIVSRLDFSLKKNGNEFHGLPPKRINILCSATLKMDVQRLGEISLQDAVHIHAERYSKESATAIDATSASKFSAPAQLKQSYAVVPAKLRLVSLIALLKHTSTRRGAVTKSIIFMSCADSVDFHFELFTHQTENHAQSENTDSSSTESCAPKANEKRKLLQRTPRTSAISPLLSNGQHSMKAYRLHGSLPQAVRTQTLRSFAQEATPALLVCTDVVSRGLDVPNVDLVIEYDPPFSREEHLHRIGRTARAGRDGRATIFLLPGCEEGYTDILKEGRRDGGLGLVRHVASDLMKKGFVTRDESSKEKEGGWENRATDWQLDVERWALESPKILEMARRAFQSHVRAYATHVTAERHIFDMKQLHLGHLCKAFGLRDKPGSINAPGLRQSVGKVKSDRQKAGGGRSGENDEDGLGQGHLDIPESYNADDAKKRMRMKGKMLGAGAGEFNLA